LGSIFFCEKPIAFDPEVIKNSLSEVEKAEVKLQVGFNRPFDPSFASVREKVSSGVLGNPHSLRVTSRDPAPPPLDNVAFFRRFVLGHDHT
jgi:Predicted dehydrogenases and related proteins